MNRMDTALRELAGMDDLAALSSGIHDLHPGVKLLAAIIYIATVASFGKYDLSGLLPMVLWPVLLYQLSGIPVSLCFRRLRFVLPLVLAVGIWNPFMDRQPLLRIGMMTVTAGMLSMCTLMLKGVLCLLASFLLMATTGIDRLCAALRAMHVPEYAVTLLLLTYRYIAVMLREVSVMTDAYSLRAPGEKGIRFRAWGSFLGQLLLRSMDRAQALYDSMLVRGYRGEFYYAGTRPVQGRDLLFLALSAAACMFFRFVPAAQILGSLFI